MTKKRIVLCADDYGQAEPISLGILNLVRQRRLTAVSCMVNSVYWQDHANELISHKNRVSVGLHFNLTEGGSLSVAYRQQLGTVFRSLPSLIAAAVSRQLPQAVVVAELNAQLDAFIEGFGCPPAFIDGHQHVHQLPVVRDALFEVYQQRFSPKEAYIRLAKPKIRPSYFWKDSKKIVLNLLGASEFKKRLLAQAIPHNTSFSGMYHFSQRQDYSQLFTSFLQESEDCGLVMCHPGLQGVRGVDSIALARWHEYQYISSEQFLTDSQAQAVEYTAWS